MELKVYKTAKRESNLFRYEEYKEKLVEEKL
jgi:hypothetical protein